MTSRNKSAPLSAKSRSSVNKNDDRRREARRRLWLRLGTIVLVIIFIASECAYLIPFE